MAVRRTIIQNINKQFWFLGVFVATYGNQVDPNVCQLCGFCPVQALVLFMKTVSKN